MTAEDEFCAQTDFQRDSADPNSMTVGTEFGCEVLEGTDRWCEGQTISALLSDLRERGYAIERWKCDEPKLEIGALSHESGEQLSHHLLGGPVQGALSLLLMYPGGPPGPSSPLPAAKSAGSDL